MHLFLFLFDMFFINGVTESLQNTDCLNKQINQLNQSETERQNNKTNENGFIHYCGTIMSINADR